MAADFRVFVDDVESNRFGVVCARAYDIGMGDLGAVARFARERRVRLLTARCDVGDLDVARALEDDGFRLMDTLLYYRKDTGDTPLETAANVTIRSIRPGEEDDVADIARYTFRNYVDHYHADPRLDDAVADEAFASWALRSCTDRAVANDVLVAVEEDETIAFATLRLNTPDEGEGVLFGVSPKAQRRGIYGGLISHGVAWCKANGAGRMIVSTQINNYAVQKVWVRLGFVHYKSCYTFHKWFD